MVKKLTAILMTDDLLQRLKNYSDVTGNSKSCIIRIAVEQYLQQSKGI